MTFCRCPTRSGRWRGSPSISTRCRRRSDARCCLKIHLGGHDEEVDDVGAPLLIDTHGSPIAEGVWTLYAHVIARTGALPTLIEWDNDVPDWPTLLAEAVAAQNILSDASRASAA